MIGVSLKNGQLPIAEEFFELFKTPWEIYDPQRTYDVVLTTRSDIEPPDADLVIAFGSSPLRADASLGIAGHVPHRTGTIVHQGVPVPIYCGLLTLAPSSPDDVRVTAIQGIAGVAVRRGRGTVLRVGFDLFEEVRYVLATGQPAENAGTPTLDVHIDMLRAWIRQAGIGFVEVTASPSGYPFAVCLTHDIDFVGIRNHKFDHSMLGFLYRAVFGSIRNVARGRLPLAKLLQTWRAAASLPLVYLGWMDDFWEPFEWYLTAERGLAATYFLIPFRGRAGERHSGAGASRRATVYDVTTIPDAVRNLVTKGCEVGVHGIDAWHSTESGKAERARVACVTGSSQMGIRMHWLLQDTQTPKALDEAGYVYDSTGGYNETIGYRHGTGQVFRPIGSRAMLELPMHIQDGALFFPERLDLPEVTAWARCNEIITHAATRGGVLTLLWHDRSHGPERYWGDFYVRLVAELRSRGVWFATGIQVTRWFAARRAIKFEQSGSGQDAQVRLRCDGDQPEMPFTVRAHQPAGTETTFIDGVWNGASEMLVASRRRDVAMPSNGGSRGPSSASRC